MALFWEVLVPLRGEVQLAEVGDQEQACEGSSWVPGASPLPVSWLLLCGELSLHTLTAME